MSEYSILPRHLQHVKCSEFSRHTHGFIQNFKVFCRSLFRNPRLYHRCSQSGRCSLFKISRARCSLPLPLRLVSPSPQWFQTPEWDIHNSSILWRNLGARTDAAFVDNDGCSRQGDWHGRLNYITFKLFFRPSSRLMLQWDEAYVVGIVTSQRREAIAAAAAARSSSLGTGNWFIQ